MKKRNFFAIYLTRWLATDRSMAHAKEARLARAGQKARVAQLVEHNLAKVGVASSNLVSRSK